jgi:hypothetical protein
VAVSWPVPGLPALPVFWRVFFTPGTTPHQERGRLSLENAMMSSRNGYIAS